MTFNDFLVKHNGKFVEAGGSANALNQCVDCANAYLDEVLRGLLREEEQLKEIRSIKIYVIVSLVSVVVLWIMQFFLLMWLAE